MIKTPIHIHIGSKRFYSRGIEKQKMQARVRLQQQTEFLPRRSCKDVAGAVAWPKLVRLYRPQNLAQIWLMHMRLLGKQGHFVNLTCRGLGTGIC